MKNLRQAIFAALGISLTLVACSTPGFHNLAPNTSLQGFQARRTAVPAPELMVIPSPNQNPRPEGAKPDTIVLHHTATAGTAERVGHFFARPDAKVSAHYIVDRTGYIVRSVPDNMRSWHAGRSEFKGRPNVNDFSIGIEICNLGDSIEPYSDIQYDALIKLVAWLVQTHQISLDNITRHRDIAVPAGRKIDTSNNFSVKRLMDGVQAVLAGTYVTPPNLQPPAPPLDAPQWRTVRVQPGQQSFEDLADVYLDNPQRAVEIAALNPELREASQIPLGQLIRLPNTLDYWDHHAH